MLMAGNGTAVLVLSVSNQPLPRQFDWEYVGVVGGAWCVQRGLAEMARSTGTRSFALDKQAPQFWLNGLGLERGARRKLNPQLNRQVAAVVSFNACPRTSWQELTRKQVLSLQRVTLLCRRSTELRTIVDVSVQHRALRPKNTQNQMLHPEDRPIQSKQQTHHIHTYILGALRSRHATSYIRHGEREKKKNAHLVRPFHPGQHASGLDRVQEDAVVPRPWSRTKRPRTRK